MSEILSECLKTDFEVFLNYTKHHLAKVETAFYAGDIAGVEDARSKVNNNLAHMERIITALKSQKE